MPLITEQWTMFKQWKSRLISIYFFICFIILFRKFIFILQLTHTCSLFGKNTSWQDFSKSWQLIIFKTFYTQTKKTMNTENIPGMFIVFWPITYETLKPQKTNGFLSHGIELVLHLFRKTFILAYKNLNCHFFLSESHMHYGSKKCMSGLCLVAAAL